MDGYLFGRKYRVLITYGEEKALDVSELHCKFRIEKIANQKPNLSECIIYNLSAESEKKIIEEGFRLVIEAGYESTFAVKTEAKEKQEEQKQYSQYGKIFDGYIVQAIRDKEDGVTYSLTLMAADGDSYYTKEFFVAALPPSSDPRSIIEAITAGTESKTEIDRISEDISTQKLARPKIIFGEPKKYIEQIASDNNATTWIDNGKLNVVKFTDPLPKEMVVVVTPETGLIGTPSQTIDGVQFRHLMHPSIVLFGLVKIDNSIIRLNKAQYGQKTTQLDKDGEYTVARLTYIGDTRGNDWYVDVQGFSIGAGRIPLQLVNANQSMR